jgi:hypothetical protein
MLHRSECRLMVHPDMRPASISVRLSRAVQSLKLDVGRADHLGPLVGLLGDELAEFGAHPSANRISILAFKTLT